MSKGLSLTFVLIGVLFCLLTTLSPAEPNVWPIWKAETSTGEMFSSLQFEGKVAVISVWASWCPSCRRQLPVLNNLQKRMGPDSIQVLAFSFDRSKRTHKKYVEKSGIELPCVYARSGDGLEVVKELQKGAGRLEAVPILLIYDKRGRLAHRLVGFFDHGKLEGLIRPLTAEPVDENQ